MIAGSKRPTAARSAGAALEAHYRFVLWLMPAVERFPRSQKFLLGITRKRWRWMNFKRD